MPQVRKLTPEEIETFQQKPKGQRKLVEQQYDSFISEYNAGEYGEAILDEADNRLTVRNRLKAAAARRGVAIELRRTIGNLLRFQIVEPSGATSPAAPLEQPAVVSAELPVPAKRKGGRPKKAS